MLCWRCRGPSVLVLPITIMMRALGCSAPEVHHLRPLSTYSSPSRWIESEMLVASELATSGSVMANEERISPSSSGISQRSFCSGVAKWNRTSMLPVSGAAQMQASDAICERPRICASGA